MKAASRRRALALAYGAACHGAFLLAVSLMARGLYTGMQSGVGRLTGSPALVANAALILQFPLIHSFLLSRRGSRFVARLAPAASGRTLATTTYSLLAALQIGLTFTLWSPSGIVLAQPSGLAELVHILAFASAWAFLGKALLDAGLGLQTGWIGWSALWSDRAPRYPGLPVRGLFARCRQPIYLGFALTLWTGPVWTPDHVSIAIAWTVYCIVGPLLKERRFATRFGEDFETYRQRVPYLIPRLFS